MTTVSVTQLNNTVAVTTAGSTVVLTSPGGVAGADGGSNIVADTTPQLGGDLDMNSKFISSGIVGIKNTGLNQS
nr:protein of unknown function [uncultured Mediterranean phage uvMED]